jgi:di/tricarboxylate transporter
MRVTNYGHAILISMVGLWVATMFNGILFGLLGGMMIGTGLVLARQSGKEE